jgi:hypothetical protein
MFQILLLILSFFSFAASKDSYDYFKKGADWSGLCANISSLRQSPINLEASLYIKENFEDMQIIMMQESF